MYMMKIDIKEKVNQREIAKKVGIAFETVNRIFNKKQTCSKMMAYCICKAIDQNAEIEDYFEPVKKGE